MADVTIIVDTPLTTVSLIAICIMIISLIFAYYKKWMAAYGIIIANFIVFIITIIFGNDILGAAYVNLPEKQIFLEPAGLGFRPFYLSSEYIYQSYTIITSMFVHGGFFHIIGNMIVFFFVGVAFEERVGWKKFIIIYILTGICAALTQSIINLVSPTQFDPNQYSPQLQLMSDAGAIPLVGASGAIFGIMGAFVFAYPRDKVVMPIGIGIMFLTRIKVMYAVLFFAIFETIVVLFSVQDFTAHYAHLGGLISGFVIAALLLRKQKTHTQLGQTIYYDSYASQKPSELNFSELRKFATTPQLKELLKRIEQETVPQVRDIWLEHFLEKAVCPKCKNPLNHFDGKIWCEHCGFRTSY